VETTGLEPVSEKPMPETSTSLFRFIWNLRWKPDKTLKFFACFCFRRPLWGERRRLSPKDYARKTWWRIGLSDTEIGKL